MDTSRPAMMPLRPLTFGELLDAAVSLLRTHGRIFLISAFTLAALEQAALYPLRRLAAMSPPFYLPYSDRLGSFWLAFAAGFGTEAAILALLGGLTATAAGPSLLGRQLPGRELLRGAARRLGGIIVVAAFVMVSTGIAALAGLVPWIFVYGLVGLATPALILDRLGPGAATGRGLRLGGRAGLRATWVRLGGYLSWLAIRLALGFGGVAALGLVAPGTESWRTVTAVATWLLINTVAYAALACLDAVLYLETRMRTEGLDISVGHALRTGRPVGDLATTELLPSGPVGR